MKFDLTPYEEKMKKTIAALADELGGIRVGRASAKVLEKNQGPLLRNADADRRCSDHQDA